MIVFITTDFHILGQIDQVRLININWAITLQKHIFGRIFENYGRAENAAETIFGQKSGRAMAGPAGPPTTALSLHPEKKKTKIYALELAML